MNIQSQNTNLLYQSELFKNILKWHSYLLSFVCLGTILAYLFSTSSRYLIQLVTYSIVLFCYQLSLFNIRHNKIISAKRFYLGASALFPLMINVSANEFMISLNVTVIAYFLFTAALIESGKWIPIWGIIYLLFDYLGLALRWFYPLKGLELHETYPLQVMIVPLLPILIFIVLSHMITSVIQNLFHEKTNIAEENAYLYQQAKHELEQHTRTEQKLRLLSTAIEQSGSSVVITDAKGHITYINPRFTELTGYSEEETIGQHTRFLKSDITPPEQFEELWQSITQGQVWQGELANIKKTGEIFWERTSISPVKNEDGEIINFIAIKDDITAQKNAEDTLAQNKEYMQAILENSPIGILIVNEDGAITFSNKTIGDLFGYDHTELQERTIEDLVPSHQQDYHKDQRDRYFEKPYARAQNHQMSMGLELHGLKKDGTLIPVQVILHYIKFEERFSAIAFVSDITRQQEFESQRLQFLLEKERINILAHFIRNAAHEFRTPLSIIQTNAYLMQQIAEQEKREKYRLSIDDQVEMMTRLLNNLITMTRLDNLHTYPIEQYNVNSLIKDLIVTTESWIQPKQLTLNIDLSDDVHKIRLNTNDLALALQQILTNAIQHSEFESSIDIKSFLDGRYVVIQIQDHGTGISAEVRNHIFERFYRADETHDERGFGLGLSIAKKIVELHQGKIEVDTELGLGTTITLYLPTN